jgi:hypothetical protein
VYRHEQIIRQVSVDGLLTWLDEKLEAMAPKEGAGLLSRPRWGKTEGYLTENSLGSIGGWWRRVWTRFNILLDLKKLELPWDTLNRERGREFRIRGHSFILVRPEPLKKHRAHLAISAAFDVF